MSAQGLPRPVEEKALVTAPTSETKTEVKTGDCCGRSVKPCGCMTGRTLSTIALVAGLILLIIGAVGLVSYYVSASAPLSTILEQIKDGFNFVATHLGTDPLLLMVFPAGIGFGLSFAGGISLALDRKPQLSDNTSLTALPRS